MKLSAIAGLYVVGILTLTGCNSQKQNEIQTEIDAAVINGLKVRETNKLAKSIVQVDGSMSCTGSLIASDIVITAAHCVYGESTAQVIFENNSEDGISYSGQVLISENFGDGIDPFEQSDLALIKLNKPAPKNYEPIPILKDSSKVFESTVLHIYGYGVSEVRTIEFDISQYPISYVNQLTQMGLAKCSEDKTTCVKYVFNHNNELLRGVTSRVESRGNVFITTYDAFKFDTCNGDSGGPIFVKVDGHYYLYGVTSAGDILCQGYTMNVDVTKHIEWISDSIEKLKENP